MANTRAAGVRQQKIHYWPQISRLKIETEDLSDQNKNLFTKVYLANMLEIGVDPNCRLCDENIQIIDRIVAGFSIFIAIECKWIYIRTR